MAAALFLDKARRAGDDAQYAVSSAGTWALDNEPASAHARTVMQRRALDLSQHRGQTVTREMIEQADLILVMAQHHKDSLAAEFPFARAKLHLLSELVGQQYDIADPYGKTLDEYEACATELSHLIEQGYPRVVNWLAPAAPVQTSHR